MRFPWRSVPVGTLVLSALFGPPGAEATMRGDAVPAERLIVQLRTERADPAGRQAAPETRPGERVRALVQRRGLGLRASRTLGERMAVAVLDQPLAGDALASLLTDLGGDPAVEFVDLDRRRYIRAVPSDPLFPGQWYLQDTEPAAPNFVAAWDITAGSTDTVIAFFDTGVRFDHPDLKRSTEGGRLLPGYDFVSADGGAGTFISANDGNGWDPDPSDPGDWVTSAEAASGPLKDCTVINSSWHGTRVAGILGALTNNGAGIAGATWAPRLLPVRVLGKCGGYDSDIIAGMRWAAGISVGSVPSNPNPAQILNLSLGSSGRCSRPYQAVIRELTARGVLVVISAGNDSGPVETPANCPGVLAVGGLRHVGTKVGYSSLGKEVGISAPAGNCPDIDTTGQCGFSLLTTDNTGLTAPAAPGYTSVFNFNIGTSFSAPIVAAVAGLMHGVNDNLATEDFIQRIKASARRFPAPEPGLPTCPAADPVTSQCNCTTATCGAGMANAPGALSEALRPIARIGVPPGNTAGQNVTLEGAGSKAARGRTIVGYAWTLVSGTGNFVGSSIGSSATVAVPPGGLIRVRLEVTDDIGHSDSREELLGASSGGGGGAIDPLLLLLALLLMPALGRRHPQP